MIALHAVCPTAGGCPAYSASALCPSRSTGLGLHWAQLQRLFEGFDLPGPLPTSEEDAPLTAGQILRHAGILLAASGAIYMLVFAISLRTRFA